MRNSFLEQAITLNRSNQAYATAHIVRRKIPSSGKPGDKAIITQDGKIHGWIGGGCTRGIVLKEALNALSDGKPRFVSISPELQDGGANYTKTYTMTCQSGGEVDVYIEPVLPKPHLVIFGTSHIAMALVKLANAIDYQVTVVANTVDRAVFPEADHIALTAEFDGSLLQDNSYLIVCTQGEGDVAALHKAILAEKPYLSFVASRKKAAAIFGDLRQLGIKMDQLKNIKTPAGLDLGAKLPEEVAISILAEIIQHFRQEQAAIQEERSKQPAPIPNDEYYMNPVCNIPVQKSTAKHVLDYKGEKVYFCCDGCKVSFEKNPEQYMVAS